MKKLVLLLFMATLAFAHTTTLHTGGFVSGFLHPISGLDHILAMVGVGMVAYFASKKGYMTLVSFISAMILAAALGYAGMAGFMVEEGILVSIAVVFGLIGFANRLSVNFMAVIVAFFGFFHGFAHGAEFAGGDFISYIAGFSLATLALHLSGMGVAYAYSKSLPIVKAQKI